MTWLSKSATKQRKRVGFRHQFSWDRHSARDCKSYQNKGNKKFTPWDLRNLRIQTAILNTGNIRSCLSSALIQKEDLILRLIPLLASFLGTSTCFCFCSCQFKKYQWLYTQVYFINCFSFTYCIIYTFKELARCNIPIQNLCIFSLPYHQALCFWGFYITVF